MPASPSNQWGLPGGVIAFINETIADNIDVSNTLGLQFSVANQAVSYLRQSGIANPASYRAEIFAAVRFGIDSYLAAAAYEASLNTGQPDTYDPPFDPTQQSPFSMDITFRIPGATGDLDRPIFLRLPSDHRPTEEEIMQAIEDLTDELAIKYEQQLVRTPSVVTIHSFTAG